MAKPIVTIGDLREALEQLTKRDIYQIESDLQFKVKAFLHSSVNATREEMFKDVMHFIRHADNEDKKLFIEAIQKKLDEKAQYPVRGEVPGTRYIKWSDFTSLPSYPQISRAVHHPWTYKQKCDPMTKDGYVAVHAIYNMSSWAGWKSSSLDPGEMATARAINNLPLHSLMQLNHGRRKDQPALFPAGLLPIVPYIDHTRREGMPFDLIATGPDIITWQSPMGGRFVYIKVKGVNTELMRQVAARKSFLSFIKTKHDQFSMILGASTAYVTRVALRRWLPYVGSDVQKGEGTVWYMATFEDGPITITIKGIRGLSLLELEELFHNSEALIFAGK